MKKDTMIRNYRKFSAAEEYAIGFIYKHMVYAIIVPEIMPRYMKEMYSSQKNGHKKKINLVLNNKYKKQLIKKGAECIGPEEILETEKNKGWAFEKIMCERCGQTWDGQDQRGFWECGDCEHNGRQLQIKFDGAQIVAETTLKRLQKGKARKTK